jgi:hypothetical protein
MKTNQIITSIKTLALAIILAAGVSYIFAWTGPGTGVTPPNGNVASPLNVGTSTQTKVGPLVVNYGDLSSPGLEVLGGLQIVDGTQGAGKVLTSDANGVASWMAPASTSSSLGGAV